MRRLARNHLEPLKLDYDDEDVFVDSSSTSSIHRASAYQSSLSASTFLSQSHSTGHVSNAWVHSESVLETNTSYSTTRLMDHGAGDFSPGIQLTGFGLSRKRSRKKDRFR